MPPPLHLTTTKVMVIVWRLRGNIIWTVLYWQRATSSMGTVNKNSSYSPVGPWVCLCVFWVAWFIFMFMCVLFYLGQLSHFPSCCGAGVTNLNEPPSSCLLPPRRCGLGAGSIPFRAIVNEKQCEMMGLYVAGHPLLNRRCTTRLPGCISLRNDLYCVGWGVKLYSLTHSTSWRFVGDMSGYNSGAWD